MKFLGRVLGAMVVMAALAGPARHRVPKYGEADKDKTPAEIAAEKDAERAYRRSLGNIPEQKKTDPWGTVRSDSAPRKPPPRRRRPSRRPKPPRAPQNNNRRRLPGVMPGQ